MYPLPKRHDAHRHLVTPTGIFAESHEQSWDHSLGTPDRPNAAVGASRVDRCWRLHWTVGRQAVEVELPASSTEGIRASRHTPQKG